MLNTIIDIIIPMYNRANLVRETLQSLLSQSYPNWVAYVVDDGSSDGSKEVAQQYADQSDGRIQVVDRPNSHKPGGSGARNYGASLGSSPYLIFLDSDDLFSENALERRAKGIAEVQEFDLLIYPSARFFNTPGDSSRIWNLLNKSTSDEVRFLQDDIPWSISGPVWRRGFFEKIGGFDEYATSWQDWDIHLRAIKMGARIKKVEDKWDNVHHFFRSTSERATISSGHREVERIRDRISLYERIRKNHGTGYKWNKYFVTRYFSNYVANQKDENYAVASLYRGLKKKLGFGYRVLWSINYAIVRLIIIENIITNKIPLLPRIIDRAYTSRYFTHFALRVPKSTLGKLCLGHELYEEPCNPRKW